jgi:ABC-type polysaccharide/polyol phosphate export permease
MWLIKKVIEIFEKRELIRSLVVRDLKARYKVSVLGFLWSLLRPLFMMVIFTIVFSRIFRWDIKMSAPYPIFLIAAILPWQFLTSALSAGAHSLIVNESLIKKVSLPREVFPIATVLAELVNLLLSLVVLIPFLAFFRIGIGPWVLFLPVVILVELFLVLGITLLVSSLNVFFRDTVPLVDLGVMAWFYLSPVFYPVSMVEKHVSPALYKVFLINPMCPILTGFRKTLMEGSFNPQSGFGYDVTQWLSYFGLTALFSILILVGGWSVFHALDKKLADTL